MKKIISTILAAAIPMQLFACSVCFTGREDFLDAFYVTTALLILLPPSVIGSIIYYVRKQVKAARLEEENAQS